MNNRKRKVVDVALNLFIEKGIQQTAIQEIIEKANISKGTFYNYFSSKNECIAAILEMLRYDATQKRNEIQFGKDPQDRDVFIEQITILIQLNKERDLNSLYENIFSSNETELRKLVLQHRILELEWLSDRFIDVMGEKIRDYAYQGAILFLGMLSYMVITMRITNSSGSIYQLVDRILNYIELILSDMIKKGGLPIDVAALDLLRSSVNKKKFTLAEIIDFAEQFKQNISFNEEQQDMFDAIIEELKRDRIRKSVLLSLLNPFEQLCLESEMRHQTQRFTHMVRYYLKTI